MILLLISTFHLEYWTEFPYPARAFDINVAGEGEALRDEFLDDERDSSEDKGFGESTGRTTGGTTGGTTDLRA